MPRVGVRIPAHVLTSLEQRAEQQDARDQLWDEALKLYAKRNASSETTKLPSYEDRLRREAFEAKRMPQTLVQVSEPLFNRTAKLAKKLHKSRDLLYADAMAEFLEQGKAPESDFYGH
jgi:hypothetical protein